MPLALRVRGDFQGSRITFFPTRRANKTPLKEHGGLSRTGLNYIAILNFYYLLSLPEHLLLPTFPVYENASVLRMKDYKEENILAVIYAARLAKKPEKRFRLERDLNP